MTETLSPFAQAIYLQKYSFNQRETWEDTAHRVVSAVAEVAPFTKYERQRLLELVTQRKFVPGGRYLYAAGRPFHQVQNCLLCRAADSREGWADLMQKATLGLMTGAGLGVDYSEVRPRGAAVVKTGGTSTGPLALMQMVNEAGRHIMQGGARRSALWAGLRWNHPDIQEFIAVKSWTPEVQRLKAADFNFPAPMDGTNISVILDRDFFVAYSAGERQARDVYWTAVRGMLETGEPGFSVDYRDRRESLRNAPVTAETRVLTPAGYKAVGYLVDKSTTVWTGSRWATDVVFTKTSDNAALVEVELTNGRRIVCERTHPFMVRQYQGAGAGRKVCLTRVGAQDLNEDDKLQSDLPQDVVAPGPPSDYGRGYVFGDGSVRNGRGDISVHSETKRTAYTRAVAVLEARSVASPDRAYFRTDVESKYEWLSGSLSPNFIAGLFDADGCWTRKLLRLSSTDPQVLDCIQQSLDLLGIKSVVRRDGTCPISGTPSYTLGVLASSLVRFQAVIPTERISLNLQAEYVPYRESEIRVKSVRLLDYTAPVYCADVKVDEHSFMAEGVCVSNCTEVVSDTDSDICNLGSLNLARFEDVEDFAKAVRLGTMFLLAGTVYSDVPYTQVEIVRERNRRLGLGLLGIHEWLVKRGKRYAPDDELGEWLAVWRDVSNATAAEYAAAWGLNVPVAVRAIAPTGTIGIVAETTTGAEPMFCVAYRRRYKGPDGHATHYQYVVDPVAKRLVDAGVDPHTLEDAYTLAADPERRVAFQAWLQGYVDNAISSTINLPPWGSELNSDLTVKSFGDMLLKYLPKLRGVTVYPDGARSGQPLVRVAYDTAVGKEGQVFYEGADVCDISGKGGTCGA